MARNVTHTEVGILSGKIGLVGDLLRNVDALAAHGVKAPERFTQVRHAWEAVSLNSDLMQSKLSQAVASGRVDEVPELLMAVAISRSANLVEIRKAVAGDTHRALLTIWLNEAAEAAYKKIADAFEDAAKKLMESASIVNIEAPAESLVGERLSSEQQEAWLEARQYAARLDELLEPLRIAAEFLVPRSQRQWGLHDGKMQDWVLALCADPGNAHRRRVWSAWESKGACGRWGKLLDLGVTLRAHPAPRDFELYSRPRPVEVRHETSRKGGITGTRQYRVDPEDALYAERLATESSPNAENSSDAGA